MGQRKRIEGNLFKQSMKRTNKIILEHDISIDDNPYFVTYTYEFPTDSTVEEMFQLFKTIMVGLSFTEEQFDDFINQSSDNG